MPLVQITPHSLLYPLLFWVGSLAPPVWSLPTSAIELCSGREDIIWNLLLFFSANYFSHAATVPPSPGAKLPETIVWTLMALFLPFAGLGRSLAMILRHVQYHDNNVAKAAAQGAIVVVARTERWKPVVGLNEEIFVDASLDIDTCQSDIASPLPATFVVNDYAPNSGHAHSIVAPKHYDIHGEFELPEGYALVFTTLSFLSDIIQGTLENPGNIKLSMHQSWLKRCVSIAQLISASYTIYHARGDQLPRYGYAAYALTVFPYAIMSLVNLITDAILGQYPAVYVLNTPMLREATIRGKLTGKKDVTQGPTLLDSLRALWNDVLYGFRELFGGSPRSKPAQPSGILDGTVGRLKDPGYCSSDDSFNASTVTWPPAGQRQRISVCGKNSDIFRVSRDDKEWYFRYASRNDKDPIRFTIGSAINKPLVKTNKQAEKETSGKLSGVARKFQDVITRWVTIYILVSVVVLLAPYMLIWALTGFHARCSTVSERAWTLAWLCASQVSFLFSLIFFSSHPSETLPASTLWRRRYFVVCVILSIASIGGMVEVGKMYLLDQGFWGACQTGYTLPSCNAE